MRTSSGPALSRVMPLYAFLSCLLPLFFHNGTKILTCSAFLKQLAQPRKNLQFIICSLSLQANGPRKPAVVLSFAPVDRPGHPVQWMHAGFHCDPRDLLPKTTFAKAKLIIFSGSRPESLDSAADGPNLFSSMYNTFDNDREVCVAICLLSADHLGIVALCAEKTDVVATELNHSCRGPKMPRAQRNLSTKKKYKHRDQSEATLPAGATN